MGTLALRADERVKDVTVLEDTLSVDLMDGRTIIHSSSCLVSSSL